MERLPKGESLKELLRKERGVDVDLCYQCAKCTNGCPSSSQMDVPPHRVVRMIQMGIDRVFELFSPWLCVSCLTCSVRCPNEIEVSKVMDFVREKAAEKGLGDREMLAFHEIFLDGVKKRGRISEVSFMGRFSLRTGRLLKDLTWGLRSLLKGKIRLISSKTKDTEHVQRIFRRCGL